jgi:hypothetical protein
MPLTLIASFAVLLYAVHEATPLKPFSDFSLYMLPLVPLLLILGASFSTSSRRGGITAVSSRPLSWP